MVMEAPPSPQCVGREFVRQYYTLLNQAPAHLHRFYNNNSSFVHGGLDAPNRETKPVVGQKQIHQKIQQLNFRDCHAKISQVDSQATLGDGVVVQVTGELSNSGQPMRRFTQTFVLAAQSPKKYYVHNDIFRYQDMICSDEETEQESGRSDAEEDAEQEHSPSTDSAPPSQPIAPQQTMAYYNSANTATSNNTPPVTAGVVTPQPPPQPQTQPQPAQQQQQPAQQQAQAQPQQPAQQQQQQPPPPQIAATTLTPHQQMVPPPSVVPTQPVAPAIVNGAVHPEEAIATTIAAPAIPTASIPQQPPIVASQAPLQTIQAVPQTQIPLQQPAAPAIIPPPGHPGMIKPEEEEDEPEQDGGGDENEEEQEVVDEQEGTVEEDDKGIPPENEDLHHHNETVSNEPKTYATLVKSGGTGVSINTFASTMSTSTNSQTKPTTSPPPAAQRSSIDSRDAQVSGMQTGGPGMMSQGQRGRGGARGSSIRGMNRNDRGGPGRGSFNEDTGSVAGDGERRRMGNNVMQQYSDSQQLFMGNLPHHATEDDLKELFSKFGSIIDLRIHSKQNAKSMAGGRVPNYGFIIFEDAATVQIVLNSRPIYFPSEGGQKLNVEEKKTRPRPSVDGGRMGTGGDNMMGRPNSGLGGSRSSGPGGMMRGGPGMGHHRGGGRGISRGDGRGGVMHRGGTYARR